MKSISKLSFLLIISMLIWGCEDESSADVNSPDVKISRDVESVKIFRFDSGRYLLTSNYNKRNGSFYSAFSDETSSTNSSDSTNLPDVNIGEYDYISIKFLDKGKVDLIRNYYTISKDTTFNMKLNWVTHCEIVAGSKALFDQGGDIKLKSLNTEAYDSSYSILNKMMYSKMLNFNPQKSKSVYKTNGLEITCNMQTITWKSKSTWKAEFFYDSELREKYRE